MNQVTDLNSTDELSAATQATFPILSVPPTVLDTATHQLVSWARRSTDKNPVPAHERFRGVVIPRLLVPSDACTSKFSRLLQATIDSLADGAFTEWVRSRMSALAVPQHLLTLDAILAFWAEEKQRATIDSEKLTAWLKQSATFAALPKERASVWLVKVPKIAAPSYRQNFTKGQAAAIVGAIVDADLDAPEAIFILQRCNNVLTVESQEEAL